QARARVKRTMTNMAATGTVPVAHSPHGPRRCRPRWRDKELGPSPTSLHCIDLDAFIVMPNHVHGIIILADQSERRYGTPEIVRGFKTFSARGVNERAGKQGVLWQR